MNLLIYNFFNHELQITKIKKSLTLQENIVAKIIDIFLYYN